MRAPLATRARIATVCLFAALALVPVYAAAFGQPFYVTLFARVMIFALAAVSLDLVLGFGGIPYGDDDYYNLNALSTLMGEGMSSRLFQEIREKRGLAYSVGSNSQSFSDSGLFSIYVGTGSGDLPKMIPVLCDEIRKSIDGFTPEEIKRARAQIKAGLLMSMESPSSRCTQRARQTMIYGRPLSTAEVIEKVEAVGAKGIIDVAHRVFASAPTLASLGDLGTLEAFDDIRARLQ